MSSRIAAGLAIIMLIMPIPSMANECAGLAEQRPSKGIKFGKDAQKTTGFGALLGAAVGGVLGSISKKNSQESVNENNSENGDSVRKKENNNGTEKGLLIGSLVGAGAGLAVGQVAESRRSKFETESAYLECEIANAQKIIAQRDAEIAEAQRQYEATVLEIQELNKKISSNKIYRRKLTDLKRRLDQQIANYETQMADCKREIDYFDFAANQTTDQSGKKSKKTMAALNKRRQELAQQKGLLQSRYNRLAQIRTDTIVVASTLKTSRRGA